jgi:small subunit ribosomal protein S3Ae
MAIGKNKKLGKKKGAKKKIQDPFARKEWYDVKAPAPFSVRVVGKTCVTRTTGTKIASDALKGRVIESSLADLNNTQDAWRKVKLAVEDVQGRACMTNFHAMDMTRDKLCQFIRKWQTLIDAHCEVKTQDGYILRVFITAFTGRQPTQARKTSYAQHQQIKQIRKKIVEIVAKEASQSSLVELVAKLNHNETFPKLITKACQFIYPLSAAIVRKVKTLKKPKFDITRLNDLYKDAPVKAGGPEGRGGRRGRGGEAGGAAPAEGNTENLLNQ